MQKLQLLDDHIVVLRDLIGTLQQELDRATSEKEQLLKHLKLTETESMGINSTSPWTENEMVKNGSDRSVSPTSPLDCIDITEDFYVGDATSDDEDHESGSQFLEDLPTPRGCSVLESAINNDDIPDMNNALSDSDDYDSSRHSAIHSLSTYTGDDEKVSRPLSSLNNADSDSDLEEEGSIKPVNWVSNTIYTSSVLDMVREKEPEDEEAVPAFLKPGRIAECFMPVEQNDVSVSMRTFDAVLFEKASLAARLANDIKRLKSELLDREAHIEFLHEKHHYYKNALRKEVRRSERIISELKREKNDATTAKFMMLCKLQKAEARIGELEERLEGSVTECQSSGNENPRSDGVVDLGLSAQRAARSRTQTQHSHNEIPHKRTEDFANHPLQQSLADLYKRCLEAEKRGDQLQLRLQKFEKQTAESTVKVGRPSNGNSAKATKTAKHPEQKKMKSESSVIRTSKTNKTSGTSSKTRAKKEEEALKKPTRTTTKAKRWS